MGVYAFIVVVDPFDSLPLAPSFERAPPSVDQRYSFPALARKPHFDSAVIGTSTSRMLRPDCLDGAFGARFVNLAINGGTRWELAQLLEVFLRHHPRPRVVILGLDDRWLGEDETRPGPSPDFAFPPWLYDEDRWNDLLHVFDRWTLDQARRQFMQLLGWRRSGHDPDGYRGFERDFGAYDAARAAMRIYEERPRSWQPVTPPLELTQAERAAIYFPAHVELAALLGAIPAQTLKVGYFPPSHAAWLGPEGGRADAVRALAKARVAELFAQTPNARLVDFMIRSDLTRGDHNFWDPYHIVDAAADRVCSALSEAGQGEDASEICVVLVR